MKKATLILFCILSLSFASFGWFMSADAQVSSPNFWKPAGKILIPINTSTYRGIGSPGGPLSCSGSSALATSATGTIICDTDETGGFATSSPFSANMIPFVINPNTVQGTSSFVIATSTGIKIGIGTSTPEYELHVVGNIRVDGSTPFYDLYEIDQGHLGGMSLNGGNLRLYTDGVNKKIRMMDDLDLQGVFISGQFVPDVDDGYDIGSATKAWAGLYLGADECLHFNNNCMIYDAVGSSNLVLEPPTNNNVIISQGKVGIVTDRPSSTLHIVGDLRVSQSSTIPNMTFTNASGTSLTISNTLGIYGEGIYVGNVDQNLDIINGGLIVEGPGNLEVGTGGTAAVITGDGSASTLGGPLTVTGLITGNAALSITSGNSSLQAVSFTNASGTNISVSGYGLFPSLFFTNATGSTMYLQSNSVTNPALSIQGRAAQTANLLTISSSTANTNFLTVSPVGATTFQPNPSSSNAILFKDGSGTNVLTINTNLATSTKFLIESSSSVAMFQVSTSSKTIVTDFFGTAASASPTLSSCGTGPAIEVGSNTNGRFTVGTGVVTSCTLTFATGLNGTKWKNTPSCFANNETQVLLLRAVATTSTLVIDAGATFDADVVSYLCVGNE